MIMYCEIVVLQKLKLGNLFNLENRSFDKKLYQTYLLDYSWLSKSLICKQFVISGQGWRFSKEYLPMDNFQQSSSDFNERIIYITNCLPIGYKFQTKIDLIFLLC